MSLNHEQLLLRLLLGCHCYIQNANLQGEPGKGSSKTAAKACVFIRELNSGAENSLYRIPQSGHHGWRYHPTVTVDSPDQNASR